MIILLFFLGGGGGGGGGGGSGALPSCCISFLCKGDLNDKYHHWDGGFE